ncbi:MAG: hypothetical protein ACYCV7_17095 [Acidimicrobiales bacterium]
MLGYREGAAFSSGWALFARLRDRGLLDEDIRHALMHPAYVGDDPDALDPDTPMTLVLGSDHVGNRL